MKKKLKIIYRSFLTLLFVLTSFLLATGIYIYYYQEQVIRKAFQAATAELSYPIQVKHIKLSLFKNFPQLSLVLHQVSIQDPKQHSKNILTARKVNCIFNIRDLIQGQYILDQLCIEQGTLSFLSSEEPKSKAQTTKTVAYPQHALFSLPINLKKIVLSQVQCLYTGRLGHQTYNIHALTQQAEAQFNTTKQNLSVHLTGQIVIQQISYPPMVYKSDSPLTISTEIDYNFSKQLYTLQRGSIKQQNENAIQFQGSWRDSSSKPCVELQINAQQLAITNLLPWLPTSYRQLVIPYQLQGKLTFQAQLSQQEKTTLHADFKLQEGSLLLKKFTEQVHIEHLAGKLHIPNATTLAMSTLQVDEYVVKLKASQLTGSMKVDLNTLHIQNYTNILLDLPTLTQTLLPTSSTSPTGLLVGHWQLDTNLSPYSTGQLRTQDVQFTYNQIVFQLQDSATLLLEDSTLSTQELAGHIEGKTFVLAGKLSNWLEFLLKPQKLYLHAKLYADHLALDKLLRTDSRSLSTSTDFLGIIPYLTGELICDIEEVVYKRFRGKKLRGKLKIDNQQLIAEAVEVRFAGGKTCLTGTMNMQADNWHIHTSASLQNVQLATLFYTFENFHQHFLEDKHLGGHVWSDITLTLQANKQFQVDENSILADIAIQLHNGVLRNFEPLQRLVPYISEKELAYLHFSNLKNNIHIEHKTIYIPPMEVHTNLTSIQLSGTHTFDGKIAYNLVVPLQNAASKEIKRQVAEIDEAALAGLNLYLKLEGNAQNYTLRHDNALFKANLQENLKNQGIILGNILEGKPVQKRAKELSQDDYFNFE